MTLTLGKPFIDGIQEHRLQLVTQDLSRIVHQTQKGLMKAISNVSNVDLIIDHSKKNYFQKPES